MTGKIAKFVLGGIAAAALMTAGAAAQAAVIPGPTLDQDGGGWTTTGLGFTANMNTSLTSFIYENQGAADTVVLTDSVGNILDSLSTPAGNTSYTASVNWGLTAGDSYWLLQTTGSNELYAAYGLSLPSNSAITIIQSGTFAYGIPDAVSNAEGWSSNEYWAAFNNITTASGVPEPSTWALMALGFAGLGFAGVRRVRLSAAA